MADILKRLREAVEPIKHVHDLYAVLNNLEGATYVETEGETSIRVDFNNGGSVWFEEYPTGREVRGNAGKKYNKQIRQLAKEYDFPKVNLEEEEEEDKLEVLKKSKKPKFNDLPFQSNAERATELFKMRKDAGFPAPTNEENHGQSIQ